MMLREHTTVTNISVMQKHLYSLRNLCLRKRWDDDDDDNNNLRARCQHLSA